MLKQMYFLADSSLVLPSRFYWTKGSSGQSNVTIEWHIPSGTEPGTYRIQYFGHYRRLFKQFYPFEGTSAAFEITNL